MNLHCYLVVSAQGDLRIVKNAPRLTIDEISVSLDMQIPDSLFLRPRINATLIVDEKDVSSPLIEAETLNVVRQAIETETGLKVQISIAEAGEEKL